MSTPSHDLHRSLLRPMVIHTLRAAGFHSTKPSVLDTLVNLTERYLLLLASTTARQALNAHNDAVPTLTDVRAAMQECGALIPLQQSAEEAWVEMLRVPASVMGEKDGGKGREQAEKRKREEEDVGDVRLFAKYFDSDQYKEVKRVAGMLQEKDASTGAAAVGVGGGVVHAEDFLAGLMKRHQKGAEDSRLAGTVLGRSIAGAAGSAGVLGVERAVHIEGGPVGRLEEWGSLVSRQRERAEGEVT